MIYTYSKLPFPMSPTSAVAFFDPRNRVDRTVSLAVFGWPHFSGAPEQRIEEKHHKMTLVTLVLLCESLEVDGVIYQDWSKYIKNLSSQFKTTSPTSPRNNDLASEISSSPYKGNLRSSARSAASSLFFQLLYGQLRLEKLVLSSKAWTNRQILVCQNRKMRFSARSKASCLFFQFLYGQLRLEKSVLRGKARSKHKDPGLSK